MGFLLDVLRRIFFGGEEDKGLDRSNATSTSSTHGGYYHRADDSPTRSPALMSTRRTAQASSFPSSVTTDSFHFVKPQLPVQPRQPSLGASPSFSQPLPSEVQAARPLPSKPSPTVTDAADPVKRQQLVNPSEPSLKASFPSSGASPSSPLSSEVFQANPLPWQSPPPPAAPSQSRSAVATAKHQPPSNPSEPSCRASPSSPSSSKAATASPLRSKPPSAFATSTQSPSTTVTSATRYVDKRQLPSNPSEPSSKAAASSSLSSMVSAASAPRSKSPYEPVLTVLVDTTSQFTSKNPRESRPNTSSPSSNDSASSSPLSSKASPASPIPSKSYPFSLSSQPPEFVGRSPGTPGSNLKRTTPRYDIPEHLQVMIKRDIVPPVLKMPLSPQNYAEYFATLLYAEDYEQEKLSDYLLSEVTLDLRPKTEFRTRNAGQTGKSSKKQNDVYPFVAFEIDAVPERRPYLLSRDYVILKPSGNTDAAPFKGVIVRVVKSTTVLAEFELDFHKQHSPAKKYDVNFSFNRVCLKRSHVAVSAATDPLLCKILFPDPTPPTNSSCSPIFQASLNIRDSKIRTLRRIQNLEGLVPYLIDGPLIDHRPLSDMEAESNLSITGARSNLSITGHIIREAIVRIYRASSDCRILVCSPRNKTCDALMQSLFDEIPETKLFRAYAAFRDWDLVPEDIMPTCMYEGECFVCPPPDELQQFAVVASTFMSSFRLHSAGIRADHFTHIFLVDASSAMEPEATVALASLVSEKTVIVITGSLNDGPKWVRSGMARRKTGLKRSLFHRLREREPYRNIDPMYISILSPN
ncbi:unnamed protein product [Musa acuminata subsp. malaccensis]|uniref:(wild Malaysian banana) hypothetical protein n=1 Tax=Musa acuminata subsp. malaccensis TaxID=214687 RepID=A0A804L348_MUSAM|nr:PREDICTED: probable RNA helicase SDE3 isoform X1 [Musa acuminata subsp. malaccensis]CAG1863259.1 unnamed protein product [Musa acuminata subsp. malaccensis]